jgi:hypothetical protein
VKWLTVMAAIGNDPTCGPEWQARYAAAFERSRAYILREYAALAEAEAEEHRAESAKASRPTLRLVSTRAIAPVVGVSCVQVTKDQQVLTDLAPDSSITGRDGKTYTRPDTSRAAVEARP